MLMLKTFARPKDAKAFFHRRFNRRQWNRALLNFSSKLYSSYVKGSTDVPLIMKPFSQVLQEAVETHPDRILVKAIQQQTQLSYRESLRKADRLAAGLLSLGLQKGDRVVLWAPNSWEWIVTTFALLRCGLINVPINPLMKGEDAIHSLKLTRPSAVIAPAEHNNIKYLDLLLQIAPELCDSKPGSARCAEMPHLRAAICLSGKSPQFSVGLDELSGLASESDIKKIQRMQNDFNADDTGFLLSSSGTTRRSKAVALSNKSLVNNGKATADSLPLTDKSKPQVYCVQVPLFHVYGVSGVISMSVHLGAKIILPSYSYSPEANLKTFVQEKCTIVNGTPTMYLDMVRRTEKDGRPTHQADVALIGAGPLVPQVVYGMTEAAGMIFQTSPEDTLDDMCNTVGKLKHNIEAKVVSPDGKTVPINTPGELWIRGYVKMMGYFGEPEKTNECSTEDGWFRTGDQFVITEDGHGKIIGRFKDIIIRGGENISTKEIEDVFTVHPSVLDAQVVGVKDERLGEECCACFLVRKPITGKEIYEYCINKVAKFKIPRYYVVMDSYPRTTSGKIQKHILRGICDELLKDGKLHELHEK